MEIIIAFIIILIIITIMILFNSHKYNRLSSYESFDTNQTSDNCTWKCIPDENNKPIDKKIICINDPDYTNMFDSCANNKPCINIMNNCDFPLWILGTVGSPSKVLFKTTLKTKEKYQYSVTDDKIMGGRVYFFYRNPGEWLGAYAAYNAGLTINGPPIDYSQFVEMTLDKDEKGSFWDYDISYVDRAALPIYMWAPGA